MQLLFQEIPVDPKYENSYRESSYRFVKRFSPSQITIFEIFLLFSHTDKPYECNICQKKAFATMEKLDEHREKHLAEKKVLPCGICHQTFKAAGNLRKHLMKRHNIENESKEPNSLEQLSNVPAPLAMPMPMKMSSNNKAISDVLNLSHSIFQRQGHPPWL